MIRTKHFILLLLGVILVGLLVLIYIFTRGGTDSAVRNSASFVSGTASAVVAVEEKRDTSIRESILRRLLDSEQFSDDTPPLETSEIPLDDTEPLEDSEVGILLGDGKFSLAPLAGYLYVCQFPLSGSAPPDVSWVRDGRWYAPEKISISGAATWPNNTTISFEEGVRTLRINSLPSHQTGAFPLSPYDPAYQYGENPYAILEHEVIITLPQDPSIAFSPSCIPFGMVGVSLDGTAFYSGLTADGYDAVAYALFDTCGGRPDESGTYHFHQESSCLLNRFSEGSGSTLLGYALDGFGMFSSVENGAKLTNDSLDVCHGHEHVLLWDGVPQNMYHYHMTDEYPYTISCFKGTPTVPAAAPIEETVDALSFPEEVTGTSSTSLESE